VCRAAFIHRIIYGNFDKIFDGFCYSTSTTNSSMMNEEIPAQVKSFILNQIVNKSKAAIVVGFVDPDGTRLFSFGNMSKAHNITYL
jgi:hypothetical protein